MSNDKLRMDAYYYGFDLTGAPEIDLILSAVACAGKSFHHTDQWNDQSEPWPAHTGNSPAEWIQNAAIIAAEGNKQAQVLINQLKAENEALRADAERYRWLREQHWSESSMAVVCEPKKSVKLGFDCPSGGRLDYSIDAAMSREPKA